MKKARPFLVAETPRAGRWNGCLLVPEDSDISPAMAAPYFEDARKSLEGEDYLAVSRMVTQPTTGRVGSEYLLLAGVDVGALGDSRKAEVSGVMNELLDRLENLVVRTIPWDELPQASLVKCPGMSEWLKSLGDLKPSKNQRSRPVPRRGWSVAAKLVALFVGLSVLLLFGVRWHPLKPWRNDPAHARPNPPEKKDRTPEIKKANQPLDQEALRWLTELKIKNENKDPTPAPPDANVQLLTTELEKRFLLSAVLKERQESKGDDPKERLHNLLKEVILSDSSSRMPPEERSRRAEHDLPHLLAPDRDYLKAVKKLYSEVGSEGDMRFGFFAEKSDDQSIFPGRDVAAFRKVSKKAVQIIKRMHEYHDSKLKPFDESLKKLWDLIQREDESCQALTRAAESSWNFYTPDDLQGIVLIDSICGKINEGYDGGKSLPEVGTRNEPKANPEQSFKAKQLKAKLEGFKSRQKEYHHTKEVLFEELVRPRQAVYAALEELAHEIGKYLNSERTPG